MTDNTQQLIVLEKAVSNLAELLHANAVQNGQNTELTHSKIAEISNLILANGEQSGHMAERLVKLENSAALSQNKIAELGNQVEEVLLWAKKISVETENAILHMQGLIVDKIRIGGDDILNRNASQSNEAIRQLLKLRAEAIALAGNEKTKKHFNPAGNIVSQFSKKSQNYFTNKASDSNNFKNSLASAERDFPKLYHWWYERLMAVSTAFDKTMVGNAANWSDPNSVAFRDFVRVYGNGKMLDVGCGVFGRPIYLDSFPAENISGLDPLPMKEKTDFEFIQGISEFLPWADNSFNTVISATSLDHALSLDKSLDEMLRVLKDDGTVLLWVGSLPGASKFTPDAPDYEPADQYHLFHFDVEWLDPLLSERFKIIERVEIWLPQHSHVFYALQKSCC